MSDGRVLTGLVLLALTGVSVVRGSRGVVRADRSAGRQAARVELQRSKRLAELRAEHAELLALLMTAGGRGVDLAEDIDDLTRRIENLEEGRDEDANTGWPTEQGSQGIVRRGPKGWTPKPGDLVGAGRWPLSGAHPDLWESPHSGRVLERNDPRAWANTLAFPHHEPSQEEVDAHLARLALRKQAENLGWMKRSETAEPEGTLPVAWEFASGKVYWEPAARLRPFDEDLEAWEIARKKARLGSRGVVRTMSKPVAQRREIKRYIARGQAHVSSSSAKSVNYFGPADIQGTLAQLWREEPSAIAVIDGEDDWGAPVERRPTVLASQNKIPLVAQFHSGTSGLMSSGIAVDAEGYDAFVRARGALLGVDRAHALMGLQVYLRSEYGSKGIVRAGKALVQAPVAVRPVVGQILKCVKSLYKSTYRKNAFTKGKKYEVVPSPWSDDKTYVYIRDSEGRPFSFSMIAGEHMNVVSDYFKLGG